jgi:hypothetical protein
MLLQRHRCSVHVDLMLQCTSGGGLWKRSSALVAALCGVEHACGAPEAVKHGYMLSTVLYYGSTCLA